MPFKKMNMLQNNALILYENSLYLQSEIEMKEFENAVIKAIDKVLSGNIEEGKQDLKAAYDKLMEDNGNDSNTDDLNWWDFQRLIK